MADDLFRIGKISSINYQNGTARVTYPDRGGDTTPEIPFLAFEYWMPKEEDQVLVAHLPNGPASGGILGTFWHNGNRPLEGFQGLYRKEYAREPGKAGERYDAGTEDYNQSITGTALVSATETWTAQAGEESAAIQIGKDGTVTITAKKLVIQAPEIEFIDGVNFESDKPMAITASESLKITSPDSQIKGPVKIEGRQEITATLSVGSTVSATGAISTQANVSAQGNVTAQGSMAAAGNVTAAGDVSAGGISLKSHKHTGVHGETSGPH